MTDIRPLVLEDVGSGQGRLREMANGERIRAANLPVNNEALAALAGLADRLPFFSGAGELSLATLTAAARTLLEAADEAGQRTAMGLGSAATRTALGTTGALYSRDSILGTVSQSAGVPTGAIIERGSNANGEYVRFADGTQICTTTVSGMAVTGALGGIYRSAVVNTSWPSVFSADPEVFVRDSTSPNLWAGGSGSPSNASCALFYHATISGRTARITGIGRWF